MRKIFGILMMLASFTLMSQTKSDRSKQIEEEKIINTVFGDEDPYYKLTNIPDSLKNESAVILCQKFIFNYTAKSGNIKLQRLVRKRIYLNDKSAVETFSQFYYTSDKSAIVGIKIIKPDGKEVIVDSQDAIAVNIDETRKIPSYYKNNNYYGSNSYKKIAIADLEPGDIIDFFLFINEYSVHRYALAPIYVSFFNLSDQYTILKQVYEYSLGKDLQINIKSLNGAPEIQEVQTTVILDDNNKDSKVFRIEDLNRSKGTDERWFIPFSQSPYVKCQITNVTTGYEKKAPFYLEKNKKLKTSVGKEEVIYKFCLYFTPDIYSFKKKSQVPKCIKNLNDRDEIIEKTFYFLRNYSFVSKTAFMDLNKESQVKYAIDKYESSDSFVRKYAAIMKIMKIPYEIVLLMPRKLGKLEDIIVIGELEYGIRVQLENGEYKYIFGGSMFSEFDNYPEYLEGGEMIIINQPKRWLYTKKTTPNDVPILQLPASTSKDNIYSVNVKLNLNPDDEYTEIKSNYSLSGGFKEDHYASLYNFNMMGEDSSYIGMFPKKNNSFLSSSALAENVRKKEEAEKKFTEEKKNEIKGILENDYNVNEVTDVTLINSGRIHTKPELQYTTEFTIKNPFNKAGKNLIFEIGSLAGSQVALEEKEKVRKNDIYFENARTIAYDISISIPEGYSVENLETVNTLVDNECCSFKATATIEDNVIHLVTEKVYKHNFDTKDKWPLYVEMLEAAYAFSQKKIILKKL